MRAHSSATMADAMVSPLCSPLFADLYALTMMRAYRDADMHGEAVFSLFARKLPAQRNYFLAAGLADVITTLENLRFGEDDIAFLEQIGQFDAGFLAMLRDLRFTGSVRAVPEGTPVFPNEPFVEVRAPIIEAQWIEALVLNQIQLQTILASKAARVVTAAQGRRVVDFGSRRAHGCEAAVKGARAFAIAGVSGTSNLLAARLYGLDPIGTMAHSFIQAFTDERDAFAAFLRSYPETVLLVDTYDTPEGVRRAIACAREADPPLALTGIRLDSGDLGALAHESRVILDEGGLGDVKIFASGGLDEDAIVRLLADGAPIDAFGVGTAMSVSDDAPALDIAYKLVCYEGRGVMKLSSGKKTLPGPKQVFRRFRDGQAVGDVIARADESDAAAGCESRPLLVEVMRGGKRCIPAPSLPAIRDHARASLATLPESVQALEKADPAYPVMVSKALQAHAEETEAALRGEEPDDNPRVKRESGR